MPPTAAFALRPGWSIVERADGMAFSRTDGAILPVRVRRKGLADLIRALGHGPVGVASAEERALRAGPASLAEWMIRSDQYVGAGILELHLTGLGDRPCVLASTGGSTGAWLDASRRVVTGRTVRLGPETHVRMMSDGVSVSSARTTLSLLCPDESGVMRVLMPLTVGVTPERLADDLGPEAANTLVEALLRSGLALDDSEFEASVSAAPLWDFADRLMHAASRGGWSDRPYGQRARLLEDGHTPSTRGNENAGRISSLPAPGSPTVPLDIALRDRRSVREFDGGAALPRAVLSTFLHASAGTEESPATRGAAGTRPYPSGGGRYSTDVYVCALRCEGVARGVYRYQPTTHDLVSVTAGSSSLDRLLGSYGLEVPGGFSPQVLLLVTSRFSRTSRAYASVAYSLVLKEVGALFQNFYLVGTALGLGGCALGGGDDGFIAEVLGVDRWVEAPVGEFMIGIPAPALSSD